MKKKTAHSNSYSIPIWLSDWTMEYTKKRGHNLKFQVSGVVVKGKNKNQILKDEGMIRHVLNRHLKKKITDEILSKYRPISVELIKQVGSGVKE